MASAPLTFVEPHVGTFERSYTTRRSQLLGFFPDNGDLVAALVCTGTLAVGTTVFVMVGETRSIVAAGADAGAPGKHWVQATVASQVVDGATHTAIVVPRTRRSRAFPRGPLTRGRRHGQATIVTQAYSGMDMYLAVVVQQGAAFRTFPVQAQGTNTPVTFTVLNPKSVRHAPISSRSPLALGAKSCSDSDSDASSVRTAPRKRARPAAEPSDVVVSRHHALAKTRRLAVAAPAPSTVPVGMGAGAVAAPAIATPSAGLSSSFLDDAAFGLDATTAADIKWGELLSILDPALGYPATADTALLADSTSLFPSAAPAPAATGASVDDWAWESTLHALGVDNTTLEAASPSSDASDSTPDKQSLPTMFDGSTLHAFQALGDNAIFVQPYALL